MQEHEYKAWLRSLHESHYVGMCNYARAFLKDTASAEDVVQEVFLSVWDRRQNLIHSGDNIRHFLIKSVKNKCIDHWRKNQRIVALPEDGAFLSQSDDSHEKSEREKEALALLGAALSSLPEKTGEVFRLIKKEGLSYQEAADYLDISVKTVENQMLRAFRYLREFYQQHHTWFVALLASAWIG